VRPVLIATLVVLAAACTAEPDSHAHDIEHARLAAGLRAELPEVAVIGVDELAERMQAGERPLLVDVRSQAEFAVSHLAGARRAETQAEAEALLAGEPREREVILYCSVGVRSGHLAEALRRAGWTNVRNLEGSIFAWANAGHPVWRDGERVREVHPYDEHWGRLLERSLWSELE
jgi:rhodanese-related sulfurtransferase